MRTPTLAQMIAASRRDATEQDEAEILIALGIVGAFDDDEPERLEP